ncbi:MAG: hypothetical protein ACRD11_15870 [Terriglobia bacterium]
MKSGSVSPAGCEWQPGELPKQITESRVYRAGGYLLIPGLIDEPTLRELIAEAQTVRLHARRTALHESDNTEGRGGNPARAYRTGPGGNLQWRLCGSPAMTETIAAVCGIAVEPTGGGSYSYYEQRGDFLALHRDIVTCDLAMLTCLAQNAADGSAGGLLVYPKHAHEPLSSARAASRAAAVRLWSGRGDTVALLGGIVPHEVVPMAPRQERIISVMCYRACPRSESRPG